MHKWACGALGIVALISWALPIRAQDTEPGLELALMPRTMTVTLLNQGGKYVFVDLRYIPQGGACRMDKDALIMRAGPDANPDTTRVRYAAAQVSAGGCPFLTVFDLANADYAAGRAAFLAMKDEASKKMENFKKELGDRGEEVEKELGQKAEQVKKELAAKWDELFGKKD